MAFKPRTRRRSTPVIVAASTPRPPRRIRFWTTIGAVAFLAILGLVLLVRRDPAPKGPEAARLALAKSVYYFEGGAVTAARNQARAATAADPAWGLAHAFLARTLLELGDGVGAEAELDRAKDTGFDPRRSHQLYAQAWLLQGDPERALAEADRTVPRYAGYAARVKARAFAVEGDYATAANILTGLVAANPNDSIAWTDLGRVRQSQVDYGGAIAAATRAVAADPDNGQALVLRGELVRSQFGLIGELPWFEEALKRDPYNHDALIEYAATLGDAGRTNEMLAVTRRALFAKPDSPQAYYLQAVLAGRAGNTDLARTLLAKTGDALDQLPGALLLAGTLDYSAGDWQQAVGHFGTLVGQQSMNVTARRLLASSLLRSGDAKGALDVLRPVAIRGDADAYTLGLVARAFEKTGQRGWAARFLDRASYTGTAQATPFGTDDPLPVLGDRLLAQLGKPEPELAYIKGLVDAKQLPQALTRANALAQRNPGVPAAHVLVGDVLMLQNRYADAAAAYRRATDLRFDEPTMLRVVEALEKAGRRPEASNTLALFLSQNPGNVAASRLTAHWQIASGDWDAAIDTLEGLRAKIGDRDAALLAELAYAYLGADEVKNALPYAVSAYKLAPGNAAAADAFGWTLYRGGDNMRAMQLIEKAVTLDPAQPMLKWHLAQVYAEIGRKAEARAIAGAVIADPNFTEGDAARDFIAGLA
ncbi:hypothetical protein BH09PSE4_BH09PSE4_04200 [soil metagenome]